jgi:hypothetical protein
MIARRRRYLKSRSIARPGTIPGFDDLFNVPSQGRFGTFIGKLDGLSLAPAGAVSFGRRPGIKEAAN